MSDHDVIWLAPVCRDDDDCDQDTAASSKRDRVWCEDDVWGVCRRCGARPTRYVRDKRTGRS